MDIPLRRDLGGLQAYLGRSKDSSIDLNIIVTPILRQRGVSTLIGILQPHYRRCRSIRVKFEAFHEVTTEILSILHSMCKGHYPMLQRICVEGLQDEEDFEDEEGSDISRVVQPKFAIVADAVNLTSVHLRGLGLSYCRPPLTAVTQLHLAASHHPILYTDFSKMLRSCQSLVTLCVYDEFDRGWPTDLHDTYDMPFLRYLRIFGGMLEVSDFLLSISAPDLEELTITPIIKDDLAKLRRQTRNAPRFPALKSLTLAPLHARLFGLAGLEAVADARACFPGIKSLNLPNYNGASFAKSFTTTGFRPFWPGLDSLAVPDIDNPGLLYKKFVQYRQG